MEESLAPNMFGDISLKPIVWQLKRLFIYFFNESCDLYE